MWKVWKMLMMPFQSPSQATPDDNPSSSPETTYTTSDNDEDYFSFDSADDDESSSASDTIGDDDYEEEEDSSSDTESSDDDSASDDEDYSSDTTNDEYYYLLDSTDESDTTTSEDSSNTTNDDEDDSDDISDDDDDSDSSSSSCFRSLIVSHLGPQLLVDWKETLQAHVFKADVRGAEDLKVLVEEEGRVLLISGLYKQQDRDDDNAWWHLKELLSGPFCRRLELPWNAKMDKTKAVMQNDMLIVTVPKNQ